MAYFPSTTGQGQGFAQMVNPRESKVGDIVSTYVDDYLEQERQSQIAQQKKNAFEARADVLQNNLDKVFKSEFNRYFSEIEEKQRKGEISAKDATDIIINYGKELKSLQDQSFKFNGEGMYSFDENGAVSDPKLKLIELGFEQDDYDDPQATIQQMKNVMMRSKKKPKQLSEQFNSKIIPLLKQVENVFTTEELGASGDEFIEIIKTNSKSIPPRILEKIKEQFVNDEDVQEAIVLNNGMYKVTPQGVDLEGDIETVETIASDFFDQMTQPKVEVIEDLQKKGGGSGLNFAFGGGRGENEKFYFEYQDKTEQVPVDPLNDNSETQTVGDRVINVEAKGTNPYQDFRTGEGQEVMRAALVSIKLDKNGEPVSLILTDEEEVPYKENAFILDQEYGLTKENIKTLYRKQQGNNQQSREAQPQQEEAQDTTRQDLNEIEAEKKGVQKEKIDW